MTNLEARNSMSCLGGIGLGMAGDTGLGQRTALGANPGSPHIGWVILAKPLISELVYFFYKLGNGTTQLLGLWRK